MTSLALLRAALAGAATGSRSMSALAACTLTGPPSSARLDRALHRPAARLVVVAAAGELVGDKLPKVPARTSPGPLVGRLVLGATTAAVLAGRRREPAVVAGLVGLAAAAATSFGGVPARAALARRLGGDRPGAVLEDVLALGLAGAATRLP